MSSIDTHTHTHKTSTDEYVKVLCPKTRRNATITLADAKKTRREVEGRPIGCNCSSACHSSNNPRCYLKAQRLKAQRRSN